MAPRKKILSKIFTEKPQETPSKVLSDKETVKEKFKNARVVKLKNRFYILDKKDGIPIYSGLSNSESNAWKRAAHEVV